ncbi:hypothetical protein [Cyclobacterium jeungdonense]|uniref:Uncharacterized protein n=1 Tax=Cyclobacterium jeungdonense TaxID=708087 RepID=A0ABT8CCX2_9BACT|nr:hypothetical protein [Cyclobacterium jeungdonense]MDN3690246.1 hypothetical protein [Cyclobacterium jeungdonense]
MVGNSPFDSNVLVCSWISLLLAIALEESSNNVEFRESIDYHLYVGGGTATIDSPGLGDLILEGSNHKHIGFYCTGYSDGGR